MDTTDNNTENTNKEKKGFFKKLIDDVSSNVKEGASFIGEKVAETSAKAYVAGSELVSETSEKIHEFTEKQTLHKEEEKIEKRQTKIKHEFGIIAFDHYLENGTLHEPFLTSTPIQSFVDEYTVNSTRLAEITKELKTLEHDES